MTTTLEFPGAFDEEILEPKVGGQARANGNKRRANAHNRQHELDQARIPKFSDEALALEFAKIHANDLRYVKAWGKWLRWDGVRWQFDETLAVFDLVRAICRKAACQCSRKQAKALASAKTVAAVAGLVRSDRRLAAKSDQWDIDPWLLNTPGGIVDLRTGKSRPHRPDDYMTKLTGVAPNPSCPIPVWLSFLERITGRDNELLPSCSAWPDMRSLG